MASVSSSTNLIAAWENSAFQSGLLFENEGRNHLNNYNPTTGASQIEFHQSLSREEIISLIAATLILVLLIPFPAYLTARALTPTLYYVGIASLSLASLLAIYAIATGLQAYLKRQQELNNAKEVDTVYKAFNTDTIIETPPTRPSYTGSMSESQNYILNITKFYCDTGHRLLTNHAAPHTPAEIKNHEIALYNNAVIHTFNDAFSKKTQEHLLTMIARIIVHDRKYFSKPNA